MARHYPTSIRRIPLAALAICVIPSLLQAQSALPAPKESRYFPIPLKGNVEDLLRTRMRKAEETEALRSLLGEMEQRRQELQLDADLLARINLNTPMMRNLLKDLLNRKTEKQELSLSDIKQFHDRLKRVFSPPNRPIMANRQRPTGTPFDIPAPAAHRPNVARLLESWLRKANEKHLGELLSDSPAFRHGLEDFQTLADFYDGYGWSGQDTLPSYLRFHQDWNLGWSDNLIGGMAGFSLPPFPEIDPPRIQIGGVSLPSVSAPNLPAVPGLGAGQVILWLVLLGAGLAAGWQLLGGLRAARTPMAAGPKPWPVDPRQVSSRCDLVRAFDHLARLLLGAEVCFWNHRAVARELEKIGVSKNSEAGPQFRQAAQDLAHLYEQARYTAGAELLPAAVQALARRDLCLLAGMNAP
jgi:hypothetical protein